MNASFKVIRDRGQLARERLVLKVLADDNIGNYALLRTYYRDAAVTTGVTHTFWFPDKSVQAGDFVVLYTKAGSDSEKVSASGATSHFYYWGNSEAIWDSEEFAPVLLYAPTWISFPPDQM